MIKDKSIFYYIILGVACSYFILGNNFFSSTNTSWMNSIDMVQDIVSWKYFKNDVWRFPIGMNPNYGIDVGNSIVFTGTIPILAIFFKTFNFILPENFHYFNIWYFICFFLQSYIAFKIIYSLTKSSLYSFLGSLFFLFSPIFIGRLVMHMSLAAHWIILLGFYIELVVIKKDKFKYWIFTIALSSLIHFYLTLILLGIFFIFTFTRFMDEKKIKTFLFENFLNLLILIIIMFLSGYFEVPLTDSMGVGYGYYKLNLASIFNPLELINNGKILWSNFLPPIQMTGGELIEGFNYIGLGGIGLLFTLILITIIKLKYLNFNKLKPFILICFLFTLISLTNNIFFSNIEIISFDLNKYIYGILGIIRASGRFFWPVYYLIFIGSIIIIYNNFSKNKSIFIISLLLILQIVDLSKGFVHLKNNKIFLVNNNYKENIFWENLNHRFNTIRTVNLNNNSHLIFKLKNILLNQRFEKTDIVRQARYNREIASEVRTKLNLKFKNKLIDKNTIFVIENENHLRNAKYLLENENVGFFIVDDIWVIAKNQRSEMNEHDIKSFQDIGFINLNLNEKVTFNFNNKNNIDGFGWTHNQNSDGIWTEGRIASILFSSKLNLNESHFIKIKIKSLSIKNKENINFKILLNDKIKKEFSINHLQEINNPIVLKINQNEVLDENYVIDFIVENPVSPLEKLESPDGRKLGILIESLEISKLK